MEKEHIWMDLSETIDFLEIFANYGDMLVNSQDLAMKHARKLAAIRDELKPKENK